MFRTKSSALLELIRASQSKAAGAMTLNYAGFAKDGYQRNPDVYACVREIATACAGIPWQVKQVKRDGTEEVIPDHPILQLLNRPNPMMSGARFKESLVSYHLLAGNAYIWRIGPDNPSRPPRELYVIRPDKIEVKLSDVVGQIDRYIYNPGGGKAKQEVDPEFILRLPMFHPTDERYGLSPLEAASRPVDLGNQGRTWNFNLLRNSARPPGGFKYPGNLTDEQYERAKKEVEDSYSGPDNAGRPMVMEAGAEWMDFGLSPTDMDWKSGQEMSTRDICKVYNVAPELVGDSSNKTYSNYKEARIALYHETVLPLMDWLVDELNNWLTPLFGDGAVLGYDLDAIDALRQDQCQMVERLAKAWWMTPNERRRETGLQDIEGGDTLLVPANMVPIDMLMGGGHWEL